jgi:hypothetical protein
VKVAVVVADTKTRTGALGAATVYVNVTELLVPFGVITVTPVVPVPDGTVVVIVVSLTTVKEAEVAPKLTDVAPVNLTPEMVTAVPIGPVFGLSDVIDGEIGVVPIPAPGSKITRCAVSSVYRN